MPKITVQLRDGREYVYQVETEADATKMIDDLKSKGVRLADIKNTIQHIPKGTILTGTVYTAAEERR
jgi:hypothetical protein